MNLVYCRECGTVYIEEVIRQHLGDWGEVGFGDKKDYMLPCQHFLADLKPVKIG